MLAAEMVDRGSGRDSTRDRPLTQRHETFWRLSKSAVSEGSLPWDLPKQAATTRVANKSMCGRNTTEPKQRGTGTERNMRQTIGMQRNVRKTIGMQRSAGSEPHSQARAHHDRSLCACVSRAIIPTVYTDSTREKETTRTSRKPPEHGERTAALAR